MGAVDIFVGFYLTLYPCIIDNRPKESCATLSDNERNRKAG